MDKVGPSKGKQSIFQVAFYFFCRFCSVVATAGRDLVPTPGALFCAQVVVRDSPPTPHPPLQRRWVGHSAASRSNGTRPLSPALQRHSATALPGGGASAGGRDGPGAPAQVETIIRPSKDRRAGTEALGHVLAQAEELSSEACGRSNQVGRKKCL